MKHIIEYILMKSEYISIFISIKKLCNKLNQESLTTRHLFAYFFKKNVSISLAHETDLCRFSFTL